MNGSFSLAATKTGARSIDKIGGFGIVATPLLEVRINFSSKVFASAHTDYA